MKKFILLSLIALSYINANATITIKNNTLCPYVLSVPGWGYYQVPAGYGTSFIPISYVSNIKVAIWPAYPNPPIINQVNVDVILAPWGTSTFPNCSGNLLTVHYTMQFGGDTLLELFN
ncbi:MAG TPA: hypothetical protein PKX92_01480 [Edaphocola sp.]|nr:hypothetical protein [Edaphocola sp.]